MAVTESTLLQRLIEAENGDLPPEVARYFLGLDFPPAERAKMDELTRKEGAGNLTAAERTELESYRHLSHVLLQVQERARRVIESLEAPFVIPLGIRRSQEAFWRDLPRLLQERKNLGKWVVYNEEQRIGIAHNPRKLLREVVRRGIPDDKYYLTIVQPDELPPWEDEEVEGMHPRVYEENPSSEL